MKNIIFILLVLSLSVLCKAAVYLGNLSEDETLVFCWATYDKNGASIARETQGTIKVRRSDGISINSGITDNNDTVDTGIHECIVDTNSDANYAANYDYTVWLDGAVIDGESVNAVLAQFSLANRADTRSSVHKWYVTKKGSNSNNGHSPATAFLTISQAVSSASNGDIIYVYPGDYDETVDFDTANLSATLEGINQYNCRIVRTGPNQKGIILEDGCTIRNLSVLTTNKTAETIGIYGYYKNNIDISKCNITGGFDGVYLTGCDVVFIKDSHILGYYDGFNYSSSTTLNIINCHISTNGTYSTTVEIHALSGGTGTAIAQNCQIIGARNDVSSRYVAGAKLYNNGQLNLINCTIAASAGPNDTGNVYGIYTSDSNAQATAYACNIKTSTSGSGDAYDLYNSAGTIYISDSHYSTASGTITDPIFSKTGITEGGTWTFADILKYLTSWTLGKWQDKTGSPGTYEIMDGEDPNTKVLEVNVSGTSPQKEITIP